MTEVRPTKRCLDDLGLPFPPLDTSLSAMPQELIAKAQRLPDEHSSGGAERIRALTDLVWFKVKVGEHRGAGGHVDLSDEDASMVWWLVAAGTRKGDTPTQDFYDRLKVECERAAAAIAKATKKPVKVSSAHLVPTDIDIRRLEVELTTLGTLGIRQAVRDAICRSAHSSQPVSVNTSKQRITAWVKSSDGESYLQIAAEGFVHPKELAVILDSVPGMSASDWQHEPNDIFGTSPSPGQLMFSGMVPPESLAAILAESPGGYL